MAKQNKKKPVKKVKKSYARFTPEELYKMGDRGPASKSPKKEG